MNRSIILILVLFSFSCFGQETLCDFSGYPYLYSNGYKQFGVQSLGDSVLVTGAFEDSGPNPVAWPINLLITRDNQCLYKEHSDVELSKVWYVYKNTELERVFSIGSEKVNEEEVYLKVADEEGYWVSEVLLSNVKENRHLFKTNNKTLVAAIEGEDSLGFHHLFYFDGEELKSIRHQNNYIWQIFQGESFIFTEGAGYISRIDFGLDSVKTWSVEPTFDEVLEREVSFFGALNIREVSDSTFEVLGSFEVENNNSWVIRKVIYKAGESLTEMESTLIDAPGEVAENFSTLFPHAFTQYSNSFAGFYLGEENHDGFIENGTLWKSEGETTQVVIEEEFPLWNILRINGQSPLLFHNMGEPVLVSRVDSSAFGRMAFWVKWYQAQDFESTRKHEHKSPFVLYPNPVRDLLTISGVDVKSVTIYDGFGKKHLTTTLRDGESIDVSGFSAGMHLLKLHHKDGTSVTLKWMKE